MKEGNRTRLPRVAEGIREELAELIPRAELAVVRGGAHLFMVEQFPAFNRVVGEFLDRVVAGSVLAPVSAR